MLPTRSLISVCALAQHVRQLGGHLLLPHSRRTLPPPCACVPIDGRRVAGATRTHAPDILFIYCYCFRRRQVSTYGADGLAFWYTEKIDKAGSLFGNDEYFKGIGIVVDTYSRPPSTFLLFPSSSLLISSHHDSRRTRRTHRQVRQ